MKYTKRLKDLREDHDLFQKDIADYLKIRQTVYSRYERGENKLPIDHLIMLCRFYNISADYILGLSDTPRKLYEKSPRQSRGDT